MGKLPLGLSFYIKNSLSLTSLEGKHLIGCGDKQHRPWCFALGWEQAKWASSSVSSLQSKALVVLMQLWSISTHAVAFSL